MRKRKWRKPYYQEFVFKFVEGNGWIDRGWYMLEVVKSSGPQHVVGGRGPRSAG